MGATRTGRGVFVPRSLHSAPRGPPQLPALLLWLSPLLAPGSRLLGVRQSQPRVAPAHRAPGWSSCPGECPDPSGPCTELALAPPCLFFSSLSSHATSSGKPSQPQASADLIPPSPARAFACPTPPRTGSSGATLDTSAGAGGRAGSPRGHALGLRRCGAGRGWNGGLGECPA